MSELPEAQRVDRYKNRRKMAWISFYMIILVGVGLLVFGLSSDPRAVRIEKLSFLLGTIFGVWVSVVLAYFGASMMTDTTEMKHREPQDGHTRPK